MAGGSLHPARTHYKSTGRAMRSDPAFPEFPAPRQFVGADIPERFDNRGPIWPGGHSIRRELIISRPVGQWHLKKIRAHSWRFSRANELTTDRSRGPRATALNGGGHRCGYN